MTTHFITAEVKLQENPLKLQKEIEAELEKQGEPLRWAITEVDTEKHTVHVEGIITNSNK
ncbi:MAG: hypothetical protein ACTMUB_05395 [cyanobacterium endosymbiont of Rhopalodia musculus]|uniref:hypothetical protein n=1 Tax=cyanobacterium endosymbiont of Epithemia clementina EcSB TaxID=3034674 RepID=UPI00248001E0|nr:hypothetical protein [cyanobacterium endosymbiont of Epithemia clementina EcSB]WGT67582.1 hypothetical protein P3F56_00255 [cyanobacterium endosymbiont of Epithemia clementina EcSB]